MIRPFKGMLVAVKAQEFNCVACGWKKGFEVYPSDCLHCTDFSWTWKLSIFLEASNGKATIVPVNGVDLGGKMVVDESELKPVDEMSSSWSILKSYGIEGTICIEGRKNKGEQE